MNSEFITSYLVCASGLFLLIHPAFEATVMSENQTQPELVSDLLENP
jgi:hypothetical protein